MAMVKSSQLIPTKPMLLLLMLTLYGFLINVPVAGEFITSHVIAGCDIFRK